MSTTFTNFCFVINLDELIDIVPDFNLYEEFWRIYTRNDSLPPQYIANDAKIERSIVSEGCDVRGDITNSVVSSNVKVGEGAKVNDSIIMTGCKIGKNAKINKAIIAEDTVIGDDVVIGDGDYADSELNKKIYNCDLTVIGEDSVIPDGVTIGKNVAISGVTEKSDYEKGKLPSGGYIVKAGELE